MPYILLAVYRGGDTLRRDDLKAAKIGALPAPRSGKYPADTPCELDHRLIDTAYGLAQLKNRLWPFAGGLLAFPCHRSSTRRRAQSLARAGRTAHCRDRPEEGRTGNNL